MSKIEMLEGQKVDHFEEGVLDRFMDSHGFSPVLTNAAAAAGIRMYHDGTDFLAVDGGVIRRPMEQTAGFSFKAHLEKKAMKTASRHTEEAFWCLMAGMPPAEVTRKYQLEPADLAEMDNMAQASGGRSAADLSTKVSREKLPMAYQGLWDRYHKGRAPATAGTRTAGWDGYFDVEANLDPVAKAVLDKYRTTPVTKMVDDGGEQVEISTADLVDDSISEATESVMKSGRQDRFSILVLKNLLAFMVDWEMASPEFISEIGQAMSEIKSRPVTAGAETEKTVEAKKKKKKDWDPNPWAVCNTTVDKEEAPEKFERCVMDVKKKQASGGFNFKAYLGKRAFYEGAQGYFVSQTRAWSNCAKCKRDAGKSAQDAWQECIDEYGGDKTNEEWAYQYASDVEDKMKKAAGACGGECTTEVQIGKDRKEDEPEETTEKQLGKDRKDGEGVVIEKRLEKNRKQAQSVQLQMGNYWEKIRQRQASGLTPGQAVMAALKDMQQDGEKITVQAQADNQSGMAGRMEAFFSPSISLKRHTMGGKPIQGKWYADLVKDFKLVKQLKEEAGLGGFGSSINDQDLDAFEAVAGKHGYSVETIGDDPGGEQVQTVQASTRTAWDSKQTGVGGDTPGTPDFAKDGANPFPPGSKEHKAFEIITRMSPEKRAELEAWVDSLPEPGGEPTPTV